MIAGDAVIDRAANSFQLASDDVLDHVARDVDRVAPQAADHAIGGAEPRGLHEEFVIPFQTVHLDDLDVVIADIETGAEDAADDDHDVVGKLGPQHGQLVKSRASIHGDRGIDVVRDCVLAATGADIEWPADGEAEANDWAGDAILIERDHVVFPLGRIADAASHLSVGLVAYAVAVVVLAKAGPAFAAEVWIFGRVANTVFDRRLSVGTDRIDWIKSRLWIGLEIDVVEIAVVVGIGAGI